MIRDVELPDGTAFVELSRGGHVFVFRVARQLKAEMMRHVGIMAARSEGGFDWIDADEVCMKIRSVFPEPPTHAEALKLEREQAKQKVLNTWKKKLK